MIQDYFVNLYQYFAIPPSGAGGTLRGWAWKTPQAITTRRSRPGVLILPGGGYGHVSPREAEPVAMAFVARGYQAFVLDYSVAPSRFPVALREAAMAMVWLRRHAGELELDRIAAVGFSAGGHLCGCLGTMFDDPVLLDFDPEYIRPDALGLCYPVAVAWGNTHEGSFRNLSGSEVPEDWMPLSLDRRVRPDMPPVFLWHTRDDASVPVRNSLILANALEAAGVDFAAHVFRSGFHGLSTADVQSNLRKKVENISKNIPKWPEYMMEFLEEVGFQIRDEEDGE